MKIDLIPMKEFIRVNNLREVNNPVVFEKGYTPTSTGVLSKEIFGVSVKERKLNFAYINLSGHFLSPIIFKILKRLNRNFESVIAGTKHFVIKNGQLVEDEENGETGIEWLYANWENIKFEKNSSMMRNERIDVLKNTPKDKLFLEVYPVIPAFYRDVNLQAAMGQQQTPKLPEINDMYCKLIRFSSIIANGNNFDFYLNATRHKMQLLLVDIYNHLKGKIDKKQGIIRKSLLGKSVDYGSRLVISAPVFDSNRVEDMQVSFFYTGVPLAQCCSLFTPFIIAWVKRFLQRELEQSGATYPIKTKDGQIRRLKLKDPELYFNEEYIKKQMDRFIFAPGDRFQRIELPIDPKEGIKGKVYLKIAGRFMEPGKTETESPLTVRDATWCDLFYMAAVDVTADKHVLITRYPLLDYFGIFTTRVSVLSTHKTMPMYVGNKVYANYPIVDLEKNSQEVSTLFVDTLTMSNLYLTGLGGDYDGDQVTVKAIFSQEGNLEAEKIMNNPSNILNIYGQNMRATTNEGVQTLYMLTKFNKK